jgi:hypothetical protein
LQSVFLDTQQRSGFADCFFFFAECCFFALGKDLLCVVPKQLHLANHLALSKEPVSGSEA